MAAIFDMQIITLLNQCYRFPGFVYQQARLSPDRKRLEIRVRPRVGSKALCSGCHRPAAGYDHLAERAFEFIPVWGFLVFLLYRMRRVSQDGPRWPRTSPQEIPLVHPQA